MAYYSGTAASLTTLRTALITHAQADGWVLTGDVLSKTGVFFQIQETATDITCLGCESNTITSPAPAVVKIGKMYERSGYTTRQVAFPCNYEVFGFAQELYLVVNYDVDNYQWMGFGKSTVPGLPGQGGWCAATLGGLTSDYLFNSDGAPVYLIHDSINLIRAALEYGSTCVMPFSNQYPVGNFATASYNSFVNSGLDGHGWLPGSPNVSGNIGASVLSQLIWTQPSTWNSEASLLPIRAWKERPSYKVSLIADLANARHLRIDNLSPGDILTLGADKWKVFPWYRKSTTSRNGGRGVNHTGTFGWAIRYQGP